MNTLPLIMAFVIVIALSFYQIMYDVAVCKNEEHAYTAFMRAHRHLQTNMEKKQFFSNKGKILYGNRQIQTQTKKDPSVYSNPRDKVSLHPLSKLNIFPLLAPDAQATPFYEITARLIAILYQNSSIYEPNLEYKIIDLLLEEAKKEKQSLTFETLTSHVLKRDPSLYKVFKGTKKYKLFSKAGYPPLADFLTLETEKSKKPVRFQYATMPLLLALFGEKITAAIAKKEKEKWEKDKKYHSLSAKEVEELLTKEQSKTLFTAIELWVDFSKKRIANPATIVVDRATEINLTSKRT